MIALCGSSVPKLESKFGQAALWRFFEFSHRCARLFEPCISLRIEVAAVATTAWRERGGKHIGAANQSHDLELRVVRNAKAANGADAFGEGADDEIYIVDHALPSSTTPRPFSPIKPIECASSTSTIAPYFLAIATISLSGAISPSIE